MKELFKSQILILIGTAAAAAATASNTPLLERFRVVLVGPSQPGNVGMIARACANFDCPDLAIVAPEYDRSSDDASSYERRFAMQEAALSILTRASVTGTLAEALSGCSVAVGFTRRRGMARSVSTTQVSVAELAELQDSAASDARVALVFGREASGLTSAEIALCTHTCEILTAAQQGSLSLPASVAFALGRTFEEAILVEEAARDAAGTSGFRRALGGDVTSLTAARLRQASIAQRQTKSTPSTSHQSTEVEVEVEAEVGGGVESGNSDSGGATNPKLQLATIDELEHLLSRWAHLAQRDRTSTAEVEGWVRTSRGSRPRDGLERSIMTVRRLLQRAKPTSRELRTLHHLLHQMSPPNQP